MQNLRFIHFSQSKMSSFLILNVFVLEKKNPTQTWPNIFLKGVQAGKTIDRNDQVKPNNPYLNHAVDNPAWVHHMLVDYMMHIKPLGLNSYFKNKYFLDVIFQMSGNRLAPRMLMVSMRAWTLGSHFTNVKRR